MSTARLPVPFTHMFRNLQGLDTYFRAEGHAPMSDETEQTTSPETDEGSGDQEKNQSQTSEPTPAITPALSEEPAVSDSSTEASQEPSRVREHVFCVVCGAVMNRGDLFCHSCGWDGRVSPPPPVPRLVDSNPSECNRLAAFLLCLLLGFFGLHRFYVGKVGTGLLWLFTLGFLGVGQIFDLVLIATGEFRDSNGRRLLRWADAKVA